MEKEDLNFIKKLEDELEDGLSINIQMPVKFIQKSSFIQVFNLLTLLLLLIEIIELKIKLFKYKKELVAEGKSFSLSEKEQEESLLEEKIDVFIDNIREVILEIASIKYAGFENDIKTLYELGLVFLEVRKENEEYVVLNSSKK